MAVTGEELAAKAARLVEERRLAAVKAAGGEDNVIARADKAHAKYVRQEKDKCTPPTYAGTIGVQDETSLLESLKIELLEKQRPIDEDGIMPPVLRSSLRRIRPEAMENHRKREQEARNPRLMELRIHVQMLLMFEYKLGKKGAVAFLVNAHEGLKKKALQLTYERYATDDELAYIPYKWNGKKKDTLTYAKVEHILKGRGIGMVDVFLSDHVMRSTLRYSYRCLKVPEHGDWSTVLMQVIYNGTGCRRCGVIRGKQKANELEEVP